MLTLATASVLLAGSHLTGRTCGPAIVIPPQGGQVLILIMAGADPVNVFDIEADLQTRTKTGKWISSGKSIQRRSIDGVPGAGSKEPIHISSTHAVPSGELRACLSVGHSSVAAAIVRIK